MVCSVNVQVTSIFAVKYLARDGCRLDELETPRDLLDHKLVPEDHLAFALQHLVGLAPVGARVNHVRLRVKELANAAFVVSRVIPPGEASVRGLRLEGRAADARHHALKALGDVLHDARDARGTPVHDVDVERHPAERVDEERERLNDQLLALGVVPCQRLAGRQVKVLQDLRAGAVKSEDDLERPVALLLVNRRSGIVLLLREGDRGSAARALVIALVVLGDMCIDLPQCIRRSVVVEAIQEEVDLDRVWGRGQI